MAADPAQPEQKERAYPDVTEADAELHFYPKYDDTYIYANDPASSKRTKQKISDFMKERKAFFCFWK